MQLVPLKITIVRGDIRKGEKPMRYPRGYNAQLIHSEGLGPFYGKTYQLGLGHDEEYAIIAVPQSHLDELLAEATAAGEQDRVQVLTESQAEEFFEQHVPEKDEIVEDREKLEVLALKAQAGIPLTQKEKDSFDPAHPEKGVKLNDQKGFKKKLGDYTIKV